MTPVDRRRPQTAPALFRLLAECALTRAALGGCGVPVAILEAGAKASPLVYCNAAFETLFGYAEFEATGKSLAVLVFRGDEALLQRLLASARRWELTAWAKDGLERPVGVTVSAVRGVEGSLTHWVIAFSDRDEVERLRAEVEALRSVASSALGLRLEPGAQPAGGPQQARVEIAPPDELHADRQPLPVLQQR
jgi:PAS domain S-box-containing protein